MLRYTVVLEQEPDGGYAVSIPTLLGCVSQGDTRAEAISNIREAIALYLEDCRDAGDPVPTEAGKDLSRSRPYRPNRPHRRYRSFETAAWQPPQDEEPLSVS